MKSIKKCESVRIFRPSTSVKLAQAISKVRLPMAAGLMMSSALASAISFDIGGIDLSVKEGSSASIPIVARVDSSDNISKDVACKATGTLVGVPEQQGATQDTDYNFVGGFSIDFVSAGPEVNGEFGTQNVMINALVDAVVEQPESFKVSIDPSSVVVNCGYSVQINLVFPRSHYGPVVTIEDRVFETPTEPPIVDRVFDPSQEAKKLLPQMESITVLTLGGAQTRNKLLAHELGMARDEKSSRNRVGLKLDGAAVPVIGGAAGDSSDSPWGTFFSGDFETGDRTLDQTSGFDYSTNTLIAGLDYKMGEHWVLGGGISRASGEAKINHKMDDTQLDQNALSLFASYYGAHYYLDAVLAKGDNQYDLLRTSNDDTAAAKTDGSETSFGLGAGYNFDFTVSTLKLFSRMDYMTADVSNYTEKATGTLAAANIHDFTLKSFSSNVGVGWNRVINTEIAVFTPEISADVEHQFKGDGFRVSGQFVGINTGAFEISTLKRDSDYINGNLSLNAIFPHGISGFISYSGQMGRNDGVSNHYALGGRIEL